MKRTLRLALLTILVPHFTITAQTTDLKETFLEAESYFLFEEYKEALPLYLRIHRAEPENDNINYKIGVCFLNDPYQREKAIRYLEEASRNTDPKYKENNFKEKEAPLEAFFYLGNAYLVNNRIDEALENFNHFMEILDPDIYDVELVEEQIAACYAARDLMKKPVDLDIAPLPERINSRFTDKNPVVSGDGNRLVYVSELQFYDATFFSEKVDGQWTPPRNIIPELGVDGDVYPTCLSYDGNTMIIYRNDDFIGNLYRSTYEDGRWTPMVKLNDHINTKYWESHGCLSRDGQALYFTSNRKGGYGGLDIYMSRRLASGEWGPPVNLGPTLNSRYNEETPFVTLNGQGIYFSSYGHYNMGGYDVFYSRRTGDTSWAQPINMGYPINTTDDNIFFHPVNNGNNAYYAMFREGGQGRHDLYYLDVYSENNPRMYMISGSLVPEEGDLSDDDRVKIYLVDRETGDTITIASPDPDRGEFSVEAPRGIYDLLIRSETYDDLIRPLEITEDTDKEGFRIEEELTLEPKPYVPKVLTGEDSRIQLDDTVFVAGSGEPFDIRMRLPRRSTLRADRFLEGEPVATDSFDIRRRRFTYTFTPQTGENRIELKLTEENGDVSLRTLLVEGTEPEPEDRGEKETEPGMEETDREQRAGEEIDTGDDRTGEEAADTTITATGDLMESLGLTDAQRRIIREAVDRSGNNAETLLEWMLRHSGGALKDHLEQLDLYDEGIRTGDELIRHLLEETGRGTFSLQQLLNALQSILDAAPWERAEEETEEREPAEAEKGIGSWLAVTGGLLLAGVLFWLIVGWRKRKNRKQEEGPDS